MIDFQDISVYDFPVQVVAHEQRVVDFNRTIAYTKTYNVKSPKKITIVKPQTNTISPQVNHSVQKLQNGSVLEKKQTLLNIMQALETKSAAQYLDASVTDALFAIVDEDISSLKDASCAQKCLRKKIKEGKKYSERKTAKALALSEKEQAENNKVMALYTVAQIQNVLFTELDKRSGLKASFSDMPASKKLLDEIQNNPDNNIKGVAVAALYKMYRPEFKKDLVPVFEKYSKSSIKEVKESASKSLKLINAK